MGVKDNNIDDLPANNSNLPSIKPNGGGGSNTGSTYT
jgi:hypothetical protein